MKSVISVFTSFLIILSMIAPKNISASDLFHDDFEENGLSKWDIRSGNWVIGTYQNSKWAATGAPFTSDHEMQAGDFNWTNYEFSFDMLPKYGVDRNVFFRVNNQRTLIHPGTNLPVSYMLHLKGDRLILKKWMLDAKPVLDFEYIGFPENIVSNIKIKVENNNIKVFVNNSNTPTFDFTDIDSPLLSGKIALAAIPGQTASEVWYDNVIVTELPGPTPEPTPTPTPSSKVVVVPGMGSGWNADAILNCKLDGYSGDWTLAPFAENIYEPLTTTLNNEEYETSVFNYDWRVQIPGNGENLVSFIGDIDLEENEKVHLVGHSMGGLVGRAYLESEAENNKLDRMITVGTPHKGSALSYPPWSGGKVWNDNFLAKIATTLLVKRCGNLLSLSNDRDVIQQITPSIQNLLPTEKYLRDKKSGELKPAVFATNNWLTTSPSNTFLFYGAKVGTLSGTGFETLEFIKVKDKRNKKEIENELWLDGKAAGKEFTLEGDGTVLLDSSQVENTEDIIINQTHSGLMISSEGISNILGFLQGVSLQNWNTFSLYHEPESALIIIGYPANFVLVTPSNEVENSKDGIVAITNPKSGKYRLALTPESPDTLFMIGQFLKNGKYKWKEYTLKNHLPKFGTIEFNSENLLENPYK